jgi:hypothetical protein
MGAWVLTHALGGQVHFRRVIWSEIAATPFHGEQAFSADGGATWETNWIAEPCAQRLVSGKLPLRPRCPIKNLALASG